uniref:Uncharacterized protein n=1 Tax=Bacillus phage KoopaTroopa TaxID=3234046 RepID=A0AB39C7J4_9CAUD
MNIHLSKSEVVKAIDIYMALKGFKTDGMYMQHSKYEGLKQVKLTNVKPQAVDIEKIMKLVQED